MNFKSLETLEDHILRTGNNGEYNMREFSIPVKNESLFLNGVLTTPKNRSKYYYAVEHPKERIVLHFTAGQIRSDLGALTRQDYHVSVAFVIGRNGVIYQLFPSKYWSGHIGKGIGNISTGNAQDKVTIGIELSNYGFLTEREGQLETYYSRQKDKNGNTGPVDIYCDATDTEAYKKITNPFRQQSVYATYTEQQYDSLIVLLRYLTSQYNIPRNFLPLPKRFDATTEVLNFKGIVSHINYRSDGKWDIGPAFDWDKLINGVQSISYEPLFHHRRRSRSIDDVEYVNNMILSEEDMDALLPDAADPLTEDEQYEDLEMLNEK